MAWYQDRRTGLELDFYRTFLDILSLIAGSPELYHTVYGEVRRVVFRRFPYVLFYLFSDDEVVVLARVHERRSPDPSGLPLTVAF